MSHFGEGERVCGGAQPCVERTQLTCRFIIQIIIHILKAVHDRLTSMSSQANGTSSLGALHDLLDPAFDHDGPGGTSEAPAGSKKRRLMNDGEDDEDEEIDVEESSEEEYEYEGSSNNNNNNFKPPPINYSSPTRRKTRSCAVPDVLKTKEVVTLDDLMKHGILRPGI